MSGAIPNVVSIAGVDPSGGAGLLADINTFSALGAYGCGVVAALTAQNTQDVRDFAAKEGLKEEEALAKGMETKAVEFAKSGAELYRQL